MKKNILLSLLSILLLSGCISNPDQGVYFLGGDQSGNSPTPTRNTVVSETDSSEFETCQRLNFYRGYTDADGLRDICIARKRNDHSVVSIVEAPNLLSGDQICIVTGVQYNIDTVPSDEATYIMDIEEAICGPANYDFQLRRSNYNVINIVLKEDLQGLKNYANGDDDYPSMLEGQIESDYNY